MKFMPSRKKHLKFFLLLALQFDGLLYKIISRLAVHYEGAHPKHQIIQYERWFADNLSGNDRVIDIGSNTGRMTYFLASKVEKSIGIEIDESLYRIAVATKQKDNLEFFNADATEFDYSALARITAVTLSNVLEHIEHRVDFLKNLIDNVEWEDKSKAKILIRVPLLDRDWVAPYKKKLGVEWRLDPTHYTEYTVEELEKELDAAGAKITSYDVVFGECYAVCAVKL